jgi:hypothetical protein
MKKIAFIAFAAGALFVANALTISAFGRSERNARVATNQDSSFVKSSETNSAQDALCKEVEVSLDEGYGVSGVEKRSVCPNPQ